MSRAADGTSILRASIGTPSCRVPPPILCDRYVLPSADAKLSNNNNFGMLVHQDNMNIYHMKPELLIERRV
jgi:hypothetical protein